MLSTKETSFLDPRTASSRAQAAASFATVQRSSLFTNPRDSRLSQLSDGLSRPQDSGLSRLTLLLTWFAKTLKHAGAHLGRGPQTPGGRGGLQGGPSGGPRGVGGPGGGGLP